MIALVQAVDNFVRNLLRFKQSHERVKIDCMAKKRNRHPRSSLTLRRTSDCLESPERNLPREPIGAGTHAIQATLRVLLPAFSGSGKHFRARHLEHYAHLVDVQFVIKAARNVRHPRVGLLVIEPRNPRSNALTFEATVFTALANRSLAAFSPLARKSVVHPPRGPNKFAETAC